MGTRNPDLNPVELHGIRIQAGLNSSALTPKQITCVYASEADVLNVALFGMTAKEWRKRHRGQKGNVRDEANAAQLVCLVKIQSQ